MLTTLILIWAFVAWMLGFNILMFWEAYHGYPNIGEFSWRKLAALVFGWPLVYPYMVKAG